MEWVGYFDILYHFFTLIWLVLTIVSVAFDRSIVFLLFFLPTLGSTTRTCAALKINYSGFSVVTFFITYSLHIDYAPKILYKH